MAMLLLLAVSILSFFLTVELNFLVSVSIIYIGLQVVHAINFHLLAPRSALGHGVKSHRPFRYRMVREMIISAAFVLAGLTSLTGILHSGNFPGWLAMGAASAGVANVVVTRLIVSTATVLNQQLDPPSSR